MLDRRHERRAHDGKLKEMLRGTVDVRAEIQHAYPALDGGKQGADGRTLDTRQHFQYKTGNRHQRASVSSGNAGIRLAALDEIDGNTHRGVFLVPNRQRWRFVHFDNLACRTERDTRMRHPGQAFLNRFFNADQDDPHILMLANEINRRRHGHDGTMVPAHAVYCDSD